MEPIRVVLADDHAMVREALARVLEDSGRIAVVGQAEDGQEAIAHTSNLKPDCLVLDYSMPKFGALEVLERLQRDSPHVKTLVLTVHQNIHYAVRALEAGANGYLIKSAAADELVSAIETVNRGSIYISSMISDEVLMHLRRPKRDRIGLEALSQREFDVLRILGAGKSLQQCAAQLKISTSTASTYRSRIMEKLNLESTAELIRFALENQLEG